jgi:hypothetical protein
VPVIIGTPVLLAPQIQSVRTGAWSMSSSNGSSTFFAAAAQG